MYYVLLYVPYVLLHTLTIYPTPSLYVSAGQAQPQPRRSAGRGGRAVGVKAAVDSVMTTGRWTSAHSGMVTWATQPVGMHAARPDACHAGRPGSMRGLRRGAGASRAKPAWAPDVRAATCVQQHEAEGCHQGLHTHPWESTRAAALLCRASWGPLPSEGVPHASSAA